MRVLINADREGYTPEQVRKTMTVGELIAYLEQFEEDAPVYLSHDNGYTYGGITWDKFSEDEDDYEEEEEECYE